MRYTITHQGVPVGVVELVPDAELVAGAVAPLPAYDALRPTTRAASVALRNVVPVGPRPLDPALFGRGEPGAELAAAQEALRRGAELGRALELRDPDGALVPADFVELTDWPGGDPEVAVLVRFRSAHAGVPAVRRSPPGAAGGADAPAP